MKIYLTSNTYPVPEGTTLVCFYTVSEAAHSNVLTVDHKSCIELPDEASHFFIPDTDSNGSFINRYQSRGWEKINAEIEEYRLFYVFVEAIRRAHDERKLSLQTAAAREAAVPGKNGFTIFGRRRVNSQASPSDFTETTGDTKSHSY